MEQIEQTEQSIFIEIPTEKIYSERAIWTATFLAGPLAGGYMMSENFKVFNDYEKAKKTIIATLIATVSLFGITFLLPENSPSGMFPIIMASIAFFLTKHFQKESINEHITNAGKSFNGWRNAAVILISLIVSMIIILGFVLITE